MTLVAAPFVWTVTAAAVLVTGALLLRRRPGWIRTVGLSAAAAMAITVGTDAALWLWNPIDYRWPDSFAVWAALPLFAVLVSVRGWRGSSALFKVTALIAPVLGVAFALSQVNAHYAYVRTVRALTGSGGVRDRTGPNQFAKVQAGTVLPTRGSVISVHIPGSESGFVARNADVYLPPAWFRPDHPRLPVIMLLHGTPGGPSDWTRSAQADVTADQFARTTDGMAPVIVFPDANGGPFKDTECVDGPRGRAETYLVDDVRSFVIEHYGTRAAARAWMVGGFSEGGTCAATLALRHPEAFSGFLDFGGDARPNTRSPRQSMVRLFGGDGRAMADHDPVVLFAHERGDAPVAWFEVGTGDRGPLDAARRLAAASRAAGAQTCLLIRPGGHNFDFWRDSFRHALPWAAGVVGLTDRQDCPYEPQR